MHNPRRLPFFLVALLTLIPAILHAQTRPTLLKDINQTSRRYIQHSTPTGRLAQHTGNWDEHKFGKVGNQLFFQARTAATGTELFTCTATPNSARLVADLFSGANSSNPTGFLTIANTLWFIANTGTNGHQVFRTTLANGKTTTKRMTTLIGTGSPTAIATLHLFRGGVYFTALVAGRYRLHRIDLATENVKVLTPQFTAHWKHPVTVGGYIAFEGKDARGSEPWWLDDKDRAGQITNATGSGQFFHPILLGGKVYFAHLASTWSLRSWDGQNGMKTIVALPSNWFEPVLLGNTAFFAMSTTSGSNRPYSVDLGASKPSLRTLPHECDHGSQSGVIRPVVLRGKVYYYGYSGKQTIRGSYLFESDGTAVKVVPGSRHSYPQTSGIGWHSPVVMQGTSPYILFQFKSGSFGHDLFRFDGTNFGRVAHIHYSNTRSSHPNYITQLGDRAIFQAIDGLHGYELWQSDGTLRGTTLHTNIAKETRTDSSFPRQFTRLGRKLYFVANDGVHGFELWRSDGTSTGFGPGTEMVKDLRPGAQGSDPKGLIGCEAMQSILFQANLGTKTELVVFDAQKDQFNVVSGAFRLSNTDRDWAFASKRGDYLLMLAGDTKSGMEPRAYNKATNTLDLLADTNPGAGDGAFDSPTQIEARLWWGDGVRGDLWQSGGTKATTKKETLPAGIKYSGDLMEYSGRLLFSGKDSSGKPGAYSYDPTTKKAERFRSQAKAFDNVFGSPFTAGNFAWFLATDNGADYLHRTDGTAANTKKVSSTKFVSFGKFYNPVSGRYERAVERGTSGDSIVFGATTSGQGLFQIDSNGNHAQVGGFILSNAPEEAIPLGSDRIAFTAHTVNNGMEVMVCDGKKIEMISEVLAPGSASGTVRWGGLWAMDGLVTFVGYDPRDMGAEPFQWAAGALATTYGISSREVLELAATNPIIGQSLRLAIDGAHPSTNGLFVFAPPEAQVLVFLEQYIYIQTNFLTVLATALNNGSGSIDLPIPNDKNLVGLGIDVQAAVSPYPGWFKGSVTNAVNLHIGM